MLKRIRFHCVACLTPFTSPGLLNHTGGVLLFFFYQVSHKPKSISHAEAASIPYVASTALSSLVNAAGLCKDSSSNKRQVVVR